MSERIQNVQPKQWNGVQYRSTLEAETAKTLQALGIPFNYEQRKITLLEGFRSPFQKDRVRALTYTPDFEIGVLMLECKGFETPEWKIKKKLLFKYLQDNEPETVFYQIHDYRTQLFQILDKYWAYLGFQIKVTPCRKKKISEPKVYDSVAEAMADLNIKGRPISVLKNLMHKADNSLGYIWELIPAYTTN